MALRLLPGAFFSADLADIGLNGAAAVFGNGADRE